MHLQCVFSVKGLVHMCFPESQMATNPLCPNRDQQQFSPNNIHTLSRDKVVRIYKFHKGTQKLHPIRGNILVARISKILLSCK